MWLFTGSDGNVRVETDINSFTEFSAVKPRGFSKNRVIRVIDSIGNDIKDIFESMYIGKVDNSEQGRNLFKKEVLQYFETMQNINAIQNFDPDSDVIARAGRRIRRGYMRSLHSACRQHGKTIHVSDFVNIISKHKINIEED